MVLFGQVVWVKLTTVKPVILVSTERVSSQTSGSVFVRSLNTDRSTDQPGS